MFVVKFDFSNAKRPKMHKVLTGVTAKRCLSMHAHACLCMYVDVSVCMCSCVCVSMLLVVCVMRARVCVCVPVGDAFARFGNRSVHCTTDGAMPHIQLNSPIVCRGSQTPLRHA